jgi:signal transduction histidine kinase
MFSSIRSRLVLGHLTVIIVAMGVSGFLLLSFLENYFLRETEQSLIAQAQITARTLIPGAIPAGPDIESQASFTNTMQQRLESNTLSLQTENLVVPSGDLSTWDQDLSYLSDVTLQLGTQLSTRIRILDQQGSVLVDSWQEGDAIDLSDDPLVEQALDGEIASFVDDTTDDPIINVVLPVYSTEQLVGVVYLAQPLNDVVVVLHDLRIQWLISMSVAMLLSALAGLYLSRAITRPLRQLTDAAGAVADGRLDLQVKADSNDEIGILGKAFNEMTTQLKAARQIQTDFVANVSHELRTPLTSVKGLVETLRNGAVDDQEVRDGFLETVENETDRLTRLVNDLLLLSQADSDALKLNKEFTNLTDLVQSTVSRIRPYAESKRVSIEVGNPDTDAFTVHLDPDRIEQVLMNLLDNAVKYSQQGGVVEVRVEKHDHGFAVVEIGDRGIGIPATDLGKIGMRFFRADKARSRAKGGSGLGLAIAKTLVELHGGELWVESQEGAGTQVSFSLPFS